MTPLVSKKTILIVDDEPLILETMGMMLELDGHTVEVASDGEAALKKLAIRNFDIVFTDFTMPKMSGNLLAIAIKKKTPQQIIVMVTGMAECLATKDGEQTSTDFTLSKPFLTEELRDIVQKATLKQAAKDSEFICLRLGETLVPLVK